MENFWLYIFTPLICSLAFIVLVSSIIYLIYRSLQKKKNKVEISWSELQVSLGRLFKVFGKLLDYDQLTDEQQMNIKDLMNSYKTFSNSACSFGLSVLFFELCKTSKSFFEKSDFQIEKSLNEEYFEIKRKVKFAIPLYNQNVQQYMIFRNSFFIIFWAKIFKMDAKEEFATVKNIRG